MLRACSILIFAFLAMSSNQARAQGQANSALVVRQVSNKLIYNYAAEAGQGRSGTGGGAVGNEVDMPGVASSLSKYQVTIKVENVGARTISAVTWLQPEQQGRKSPFWHKLRIRRVILPGQTVELKKSVLADSSIDDRAVIEKIEFADGTIWQRPDPKKKGVKASNK